MPRHVDEIPVDAEAPKDLAGMTETVRNLMKYYIYALEVDNNIE